MIVFPEPDRLRVATAGDAPAAEAKPVVLFIGDAAWPEFVAVHGWIETHSHLTTCADLQSAAAQVMAGAVDPELIVLALTWPGEFSGGEVDRLRYLVPQARLSELLGSCCEGPARTAPPAPGAMRHHWHQWIARFEPEFVRRTAGQCPTWSLPLTATDEERLLALPRTSPARDRGLIVVVSRHGELARALCDACPQFGFAGLWIRPQSRGPYLAGVRAVVWEAPCSPAAWSSEIAEFQSFHAPVVALTSFPRAADIERFRAAGAAAVVSQPFWLGDLFGQIDRI